MKIKNHFFERQKNIPLSVILKILGKKNIKVIGNSTKPEGVFARGGSRLLQKKYGFVPKVSIDQGIKWAIKYFQRF